MEKEKQVMRIRNNHIRGSYNIYSYSYLQDNSDIKHFTALRKLTHRREVVDGSLKRRDIIEDYNNYASQVTIVSHKHSHDISIISYRCMLLA